MKSKTITTYTPEETISFAEKLVKHLKVGDIVCLHGDLGAGKTTFVKGLAKGLKIKPSKVTSPTFVLMNIYESKPPIYHFDLYRIEGNAEVAMLGYEEFLYGDGIAVIEWAKRLGALMPRERLEIEFKHKGGEKRSIRLQAKGKHYEDFIRRHFQ